MNDMTILIVEDDASVRNLMSMTLRAHHYRYLTAQTGEAAILEITSHSPSVVLRRLARSLPEGEPVFTNGALVIDYKPAEVRVSGREIALTPNEYRLLCLFAKNVGKVLTHTYITDKIWGNSLESDVATLRVFMASLRKKIESDSAQPKLFQTHIGIGYRMNRL